MRARDALLLEADDNSKATWLHQSLNLFQWSVLLPPPCSVVKAVEQRKAAQQQQRLGFKEAIALLLCFLVFLLFFFPRPLLLVLSSPLGCREVENRSAWRGRQVAGEETGLSATRSWGFVNFVVVVVVVFFFF